MNNFFKIHKVKILKAIHNSKFSCLLFDNNNYLGAFIRPPFPLFLLLRSKLSYQ
jgi:hypothetical protein